MTDQSFLITLNANQRRHFEVVLGRLEESLTKIERLLDDPQSQSLTIIEDDVSADFRATAKTELPRLRRDVERLVAGLALKPKSNSLRRIIGATLTFEAVRIEDSFSSRLRGYGSIDPNAAERLDPELESLARSLETLATAVKR